MALKCFISGITLLAQDIGAGLQPTAAAENVPLVLENGTLLLEPSNPVYGLAINGQPVLVQASDTLASIRTKIQAACVQQFNEKLSRTDGSTIQFVWLDDRGLL